MRAFAALLFPLALAGCAWFSDKPPENDYASTSQNQFVGANYRAADALLSQLNGRLAGDKPLGDLLLAGLEILLACFQPSDQPEEMNATIGLDDLDVRCPEALIHQAADERACHVAAADETYFHDCYR